MRVHFGLLEVDQQQFIVGGAEIVEALGDGLTGEALDALQLDNEPVFDEEIGHVLSDVFALVRDRQVNVGARSEERRVGKECRL